MFPFYFEGNEPNAGFALNHDNLAMVERCEHLVLCDDPHPKFTLIRSKMDTNFDFYLNPEDHSLEIYLSSGGIQKIKSSEYRLLRMDTRKSLIVYLIYGKREDIMRKMLTNEVNLLSTGQYRAGSHAHTNVKLDAIQIAKNAPIKRNCFVCLQDKICTVKHLPETAVDTLKASGDPVSNQIADMGFAVCKDCTNDTEGFIRALESFMKSKRLVHHLKGKK